MLRKIKELRHNSLLYVRNFLPLISASFWELAASLPEVLGSEIGATCSKRKESYHF